MLRKDTIGPIFYAPALQILGYYIFVLFVTNEKNYTLERSPLYPAPPVFGFPLAEISISGFTSPFAPAQSICFLTPLFAPEFP